MQNYEYKFVDKKVVLSEQEHQQVLALVEHGQTIVVLRAGSVIVNMSLIGTVTPTDEMTSAQAVARLERSGEQTKMLSQGKLNSFPDALRKMRGWAERQSWFDPAKARAMSFRIKAAHAGITYTANDPRAKLQKQYERGEVDVYGQPIELTA